jgi:hypothetical protein
MNMNSMMFIVLLCVYLSVQDSDAAIDHIFFYVTDRIRVLDEP